MIAYRKLHIMKKKFLLFNLFLSFAYCSFAQVVESEKIDWENLPAFSAKSFVFKSGQINYECTDCRYVELRSNSGVSGYLLLGQAAFSIPNKKISGNSSAIMIRINPKDSSTFLQISNSEKLEDIGFVSLSLLILNNTFKRCYHSGMDALIPLNGEYAVDIFSDKEGDMLVSYADKKIQIFNISKRKSK